MEHGPAPGRAPHRGQPDVGRERRRAAGFEHRGRAPARSPATISRPPPTQRPSADHLTLSARPMRGTSPAAARSPPSRPRRSPAASSSGEAWKTPVWMLQPWRRPNRGDDQPA